MQHGQVISHSNKAVDNGGRSDGRVKKCGRGVGGCGKSVSESTDKDNKFDDVRPVLDDGSLT